MAQGLSQKGEKVKLKRHDKKAFSEQKRLSTAMAKKSIVTSQEEITLKT